MPDSNARDASSRVLVDRTVLRVDGRPYFSYGPQVLLTPPARYGEALAQIASLGFTAVASPPASLGTIPLLDEFFDAAERAELMVLLVADPRVRDHGRALAEHFSHRRSLLGYQLPPSLDDAELPHYLAERDAIRTRDLFHPIFAPLPESLWEKRWFSPQDLYAAVTPAPTAPGGRFVAPVSGQVARRLLEATPTANPRPVFCTDLPVTISDRERATGLYDDDPVVAAHSRRRLDWYPYYHHFDGQSRRDLLGPVPELLRLQVYGLLMAGVRGIMLDFYEAMLGASPGSGRDRLAEASLLAREITLLRDFLAEGRPAGLDVDSGHPRLEAASIQHGRETLILLRMSGYEDEFFVDECFLERTEVSVFWRDPGELNAYRLDFPKPRKLEIIRDQAGSIRLLAGELELTGAILLTPGQQRAEDLIRTINAALPGAAAIAVDGAAMRYAKVEAIESELMSLGLGMDNRERLRAVHARLVAARQALQREDFALAFDEARTVGRFIRRLVKYQMAKALAMPLMDQRGNHPLLRTNYYTLPRFYRENQAETAKAFLDIT